MKMHVVISGKDSCELLNSRASAWEKSQAPWKELYGCLAAVMHHILAWHDVPSGHQSHRKYHTFVIPPLCNNAFSLHSSTAEKQTSLSKISQRG
jgi:hypothetical protein